VAPDVTSRVTIHFENVQAADAMRAIIAEAGLSVLTAPRRPNWPPVVFHELPVNLDDVSVERMMERFGVSAEMAQWIVESRP
jgi:aspartate aminotransferase-like enzyme